MVVIACCYCSPDPEGPKYEQYCMQKLMQHQSFRQLEDLLGASNIHLAAYSGRVQSIFPLQMLFIGLKLQEEKIVRQCVIQMSFQLMFLTNYM